MLSQVQQAENHSKSFVVPSTPLTKMNKTIQSLEQFFRISFGHHASFQMSYKRRFVLYYNAPIYLLTEHTWPKRFMFNVINEVFIRKSVIIPQ